MSKQKERPMMRPRAHAYEQENPPQPSGLEEEKNLLYARFSSLLTRDQWNKIFKNIARMKPEERAKLKSDYSDLLTDEIS